VQELGTLPGLARSVLLLACFLLKEKLSGRWALGKNLAMWRVSSTGEPEFGTQACPVKLLGGNISYERSFRPKRLALWVKKDLIRPLGCKGVWSCPMTLQEEFTTKEGSDPQGGGEDGYKKTCSQNDSLYCIFLCGLVHTAELWTGRILPSATPP